ncbi:peptide chain release factor N(5)-glutamine methyltransferase [Mycoplasma sp. NEAQ87857]|uniref:peptide chain release factor N(5)-glutamine methyltransferase n=1 Tax=Mycoplasma sp. NEAQ87857 TaxID=2683967 RepID=UPI001318F4D4|nr:peptide chain release factor N(5)-glutamine methyltransferase [Mycoplasma sp. NEAQ87857]QGZ97585.1 peptide chain release factor N(5)-glutamine methyltransferase [Mycoplasma sp. NEAQ87857]
MPTKEDLLLEKRRYGLDQTISPFELEQLNIGTPVQKIIGYVEMADVVINLDHNVLIPRYETEELILKVVNDIKIQDNLDILDLCCGSGFIGLAIKKAKPNCNLILSDISNEAILQSQKNAKLNQLKVDIIESDLFNNIEPNSLDIIVSNPPYLDVRELISDSVLNFEPHLALFADDQGLYFYKKIIEQAPKYLKNQKGLLYFEINPLHLEYWEDLATKMDLEIINDIANLARIVKIKFK